MKYKLGFCVDKGICSSFNIQWHRFCFNRTFCDVPRVGEHVIFSNCNDLPEHIADYCFECVVTNVTWFLKYSDIDDNEYVHAQVNLEVKRVF